MRAAAVPTGVLGLVVAVVALACSAAGAEDARTISTRFSRFSEDLIEVRAGQPVTFELRNEDPILHEWIVGPPDVHERHRTGTEPYHDEVPTEVSLPPYETRLTTVTFEAPGEYLFICHLPGH